MKKILILLFPIILNAQYYGYNSWGEYGYNPIILEDGFLPQTDTLVNRFTISPITEVKYVYDSTFRMLIDSGAWAYLDWYYEYACHDQQAAAQNWVENDHNITEMFSPLWYFGIGYRGTTGTAGAYLITNFNMSTDAVYFEQDSNSVGAYINQEATVSNQWFFAVANSASTALIGVLDRIEGVSDLAYNNSFSSIPYDPGTSDFLLTIDRYSADSVKFLKNGIVGIKLERTSVTVPPHPMYIFARNNYDVSVQRGNDAIIEMFYGGGDMPDNIHRAIGNIHNYFKQRINQLYP